MSLRWTLRVDCDLCGRRSDPRETSGPGTSYGLTLRALRLALRESGWTSRALGGPNPHRDYCPNCSEGRP